MDLGAMGRVVRRLVDRLVRGPERREIATRAGDVFHDEVSRAFRDAVDPVTGVAWAPLKVRVGRPLIDTGELMMQALMASSSVVVTRDGFEASLEGPAYAWVHQFGAGHVPARPYFGVGPAALSALATDIAELTAQSVVQGVRT